MSKVAKIFTPKIPKQAAPATARVEDPTSPGKSVTPESAQAEQKQAATRDEVDQRKQRDSRLRALRGRNRRRNLITGSETGQRARDTRLG